MTHKESYKKAIELLFKLSTKNGFLASADQSTNYNRVWARDGVICGLAAILDGNSTLLDTFKSTLITLSQHQHHLGHIPSNVYLKEKGNAEVSFGGLAGRVDTISWYIIGICNYCYAINDMTLLNQYEEKINRALGLLQAWEFNNNNLLYVPRSGNWADEYITEGHIFYDQLLRLWALRCLHQLKPKIEFEKKIHKITKKIEDNFRKTQTQQPYHPKAHKKLKESTYWMASISPSGYQTMYDAFGNSLAIFLNIGDSTFKQKVFDFSESLRRKLPLGLLPAFWPPITPKDKDWEVLENNCKYEFRNYPFQFHNGGTWQMINGIYGMAVQSINSNVSIEILKEIKELNAQQDFSFYENFDSNTCLPSGVKQCGWSAAGEIILEQSLNNNNLLK